MKITKNNALFVAILNALIKIKQTDKSMLVAVIVNSIALLALCMIFPLNTGSVLAIWLWIIWCVCYYFLVNRELLATTFVVFLILLLLSNEYFIVAGRFYYWYFASFVLIFFLMLKRTIKINKFMLYISLYYFFFTLIYYFINQTDMGVLYAFKYYFVNILMVLILYCYLNFDYKRALHICLSIFLIALIFSMAQFLGNYVFSMEGNPFNIKLTNLEMRPASFFSETTWVAECSVLTLLLAMYMKKIKMIALPSLWLILILCFAVLSVTTTRAAYLALIIVCLYNIKIWNIKVLFSLWALCCLTAFALYMLSPEIFLSKLSYFMQRAQLHDLSAHGRYESIVLTFYGIAENIWVMLFGHGFVWSSVADATVSGAATGAKSFSLLLFIPYVFGVFGLLVFGLSLFEVFVRYQKLNVTDYSRVYGATILLAYLVISSVAPLFQYSLGVIWLALALCILYYGAKYDAS